MTTLAFTDAQRSFLRPPRLAHVATVGPGGTPHVVPHWYVLEGDVFYFTTVRTRRTARYLARDPRAAFVVDDATFEGRQGIEIDLTVEFVPDEAERVASALALRYLGPVAGPPYAEEMMAVAGRSAIRAVPRRIRSWGL
jgi:PPOX class probable F420-dependent enzyme